MRIAVVSRYFPSSAEPWQGRSAYQTLRVMARKADLRVFYPNANYPVPLNPRSRSYTKLDASFSVPDVRVSYYDYFALPLLSRPFNGWSAARALLAPIRAFAPDLILGYFLYPEGYAALKIARTLGVPVVVKSIGSDINRICDPISEMQTCTVLREADFVVTVSDDLRSKAIVMGASPERTPRHRQRHRSLGLLSTRSRAGAAETRHRSRRRSGRVHRPHGREEGASRAGRSGGLAA